MLDMYYVLDSGVWYEGESRENGPALMVLGPEGDKDVNAQMFNDRLCKLQEEEVLTGATSPRLGSRHLDEAERKEAGHEVRRAQPGQSGSGKEVCLEGRNQPHLSNEKERVSENGK